MPITNTDRTLAASALQKRVQNQKPTREELAALRRVEKVREEEQRWAIYRSVPQRHYREMSGRHPRTLIDQARLYGAPIGEKVIDLPAVVKWMHDFLAENSQRLNAAGDQGEVSAELDRKRRIEADRLEIKLRREQGEVVPIDEIHAAHTVMASLLRAAGQKLQVRFGTEAFQILDSALARFEEMLDKSLPQPPKGETETTG